MFNLAACVKPIQLWHGNVENHNVGLCLGHQPEEGPSVIDEAQDFKLGFEEVLASFGYQRVVIGNQQSSPLTMLHFEVSGLN